MTGRIKQSLTYIIFLSIFYLFISFISFSPNGEPKLFTTVSFPPLYPHNSVWWLLVETGPKLSSQFLQQILVQHRNHYTMLDNTTKRLLNMLLYMDFNVRCLVLSTPCSSMVQSITTHPPIQLWDRDENWANLGIDSHEALKKKECIVLIAWYFWSGLHHRLPSGQNHQKTMGLGVLVTYFPTAVITRHHIREATAAF